MINPTLRAMFESKTMAEAEHKRDRLINDFCDVAEKAIQTLENGFKDATSVYLLPSTLRKMIYSGEPMDDRS